MTSLANCIDGVPNISGAEAACAEAMRRTASQAIYLPDSGIDWGQLKSAGGIALHMHQPLLPAGGDDLRTAAIISNLKHMMDHLHVHDNHNAPVFLHCYKRMGVLIPQLLGEGNRPRVMLEYSGTLLHGLRQMGADDVLDALRFLITDRTARSCVEWLGMPWGHAVAPSTPIQDFRLHVLAWQNHFAALFGLEALSRVRGFSPSEMALPNHPDVAYAFVRTLKDAGYQWVLVQEHTVEQPETGSGPERKHLPHRLVCRNSGGETVSIIAIIKTQGSDTKLVGQMQPYFEAHGLSRCDLAGRSVPQVVTQIADGENGGVMMNEFPPKFIDVVREASGSETSLVNISEYLEYLSSMGLRETDFPTLQPIMQKRIWDRIQPSAGPEALTRAIEELKREDPRFHMEGGSWTNNISWVRGYDNVMDPMEQVSALFYEKIIKAGIDPGDDRYRNALFHLLTSQTSCYRYWGQGAWTDYGQEICRRAEVILSHTS